MSEPLSGPYHVEAGASGRSLLIYSREGWQVATGVSARVGGDPTTMRVTAELLAAAWELREALEAVEWSRHGIVDGQVQPVCAVCDASRAEGHRPGCRVGIALRKARGHAGHG